MTAEEICEKYGCSMSSLTTNFNRFAKKILKEKNIRIVKEGRGKNATYIEMENDNRALTNTNYRTAFTVYNKCSTAQNVDIAFAPGSANTMPIEAIKYAIYEQGATVPTAGTALSTNKIITW